MRNVTFKGQLTEDIGGLGNFPEAFDLIVGFFVSLLGTLSTLVSLAFGFGVGRDFLTFLDSGSEAEPSRSLGVAAFFRRLLGFVSALDSGRVDRFCFLGGEGVEPPFFSAWSW